MKSSSTVSNLETHYYKKPLERNKINHSSSTTPTTGRFGFNFFGLLAIISIVTLTITIYSPNPFKILPKQERFSQWQSNLQTQTKKHKDFKDDQLDKCDLFKGQWVPNLRGPMYTNQTCPSLPDSKNCKKHGRKDVDFMYWRWKPDGCEVPRFHGNDFLEMVRGKKMAFIGDSVARNQIESLLCLLSQVQMPVDIYKDSEDRYRTWYFPTHNFTLMVYWTKYMVVAEERVINGSLSGFYDLQLDKIEKNWTQKLPGLDYAIISGAHWFYRKLYLHEGDKLLGCVFCDEANVTKVPVSSAVQMALRTALKYINECKECGDLTTFVRTFAPAHFEYGIWNSGGTCNRTSPYTEEQINLASTEWELRSLQVVEVEAAKEEGKKSGKRFESLDVTRAMLMRPDGHPGPYWNNQFMKGYNDCLHWCLPGPIDVWNDLLLVVLKKVLKKAARSSLH